MNALIHLCKPNCSLLHGNDQNPIDANENTNALCDDRGTAVRSHRSGAAQKAPGVLPNHSLAERSHRSE